MLKFKAIEKFGNTKVKLRIGGLSAEPKIQPHPLFQQIKEIELINDDLNVKCLQLMNRGEVQIEAQRGKAFIQRCHQILDFEPILKIEQLSVALLANNEEGIGKVLDFLQFGDLFSVLKFCFEKTVQKSHGRIIRKIKSYIKGSGRQQGQKQSLQNLLKFYKESEKILQDQIQNPVEKEAEKVKTPFFEQKRQQPSKKKIQSQENKGQEKKEEKIVPLTQKKISIKEEGFSNSENQVERELASLIPVKSAPTQSSRRVKKANHQGSNDLKPANNDKKQSRKTSYSRRDNYSKDRRNQQSKEKRDPKIYLAINGDTQSGWRERYRPPRVPQYKKDQRREYKKQKKQPQITPKKQTKQVINQNNQKQQTLSSKPLEVQIKKYKQDVPDSDKSLKLVYSYPEDGANFSIAPYKNNLKCHINNNFWVEFKEGVLKIMKGQNGYIRDSTIDILGDGFLAQGLTLRLGSLSNIEDGGQVVGNPSIEAFTGNKTQFFNIQKLKIYSGTQGNKIEKVEKKEQKIEADNEVDCEYEESREERQAKLEKQKQSLQGIQKANSVNKENTQNKAQENNDSEDWEEEDYHKVASGKHKKEKKRGKGKKQNKGKMLGDELKIEETGNKEDQEKSQEKANKRHKSKTKKKQQNPSKPASQKQEKKSDQNEKILLGIRGSTEHGWRQTNRNQENLKQDDVDLHEDKTKEKKSKNKKKHKKSNSGIKSQAEEQTNKKQSESSKKVEVQESEGKIAANFEENNSYILLFEFPKDGITFDFSKLGEDFRLLVNNNFWIYYKDGTMVIKKGNNGFIRKSKIDFISNGFLSEGVTFKLDGTSNIEDGGQQTGSPIISEFTGSDAQFYHISSVQIYKKKE